MNSTSSDQDGIPPPAPWPGALLDGYVAVARTRPNAAEAMALRTRSTAMRRILAHAASLGKLDEAGVRQAVLNGEEAQLDPLWLAKLARVCSLQQLRQDDIEFSLAALGLAFRTLPTNRITARYRKLHVELLVGVGDTEAAKAIVESDSEVRQRWPHFIADMLNPVLTCDPKTEAAWIHEFNNIYRKYALTPVELTSVGPSPFDRLNTHRGTVSPVEVGPLVSVIMTTYKPDPESLQNSLNSVLNQTWRNLEVLLVDDGSPEPYCSWIRDLSEADSRIRPIIVRENAGTYAARNQGIKYAEGKYVTGQDDDDWSHPERIERQVSKLEQKRISGTVVSSLRANSDLLVTSPGVSPIGGAAASFMTYTQLAREVGGYLHMRKAADYEFLHRIEAYTKQRVVSLKEPLMTIRRRDESLSRRDYRPGWSHPARRSFRSAYSYWHKTASAPSLQSGGLVRETLPIVVPDHLAGGPKTPVSLDVVFAANWQENNSTQRAMLAEVRALRAANLRVGVLNLESPRVMARVPKPLIGPIQSLINEGAVSEILPDSQAQTSLLILRSPLLLQFPPAHSYSIDVRKLVIVADEFPEGDDRNAVYAPSLCAEHAASLFGARAEWIALSNEARTSLARCVPPDEVCEELHYPVVRLDEWRTNRKRDLGRRPIVGWLTTGSRKTFIEDRDALRALLPGDGSVDIRIRGDASHLLRTLGFDRPPANWLIYRPNDISVRAFYHSVDFILCGDRGPADFSTQYAIVEALASGCVVILPPSFEEFFGAAAIYAEHNAAQRVVASLHRDPDAYRKQAEVALQEVASRFSAQRFEAFVRTQIDGTPGDGVEKGALAEGAR